MAEAGRQNWVPALTLHLQLSALPSLGIDASAVRERVGPLPTAPDALVPVQAYLDMWAAAQAQYRLPGLPTAVAMALPFGAFGALDYLCGSAATVEGACESAKLYFAMVTTDTWLEVHRLDDGTCIVQIGADNVPLEGLEFTLAALVSRLRYMGGDAFRLLRLCLPVAAPVGDDPVRTALYGVRPVYGAPTAEVALDATVWQSPLAKADPLLHKTLREMADRLGLARPGRDSSLEQALRARLRDGLAQGRCDPGRLALLLGLSERTLQRRLTEVGRSFSEVVEDFRREEAVRLLARPEVPLVAVSSRLGYAEQTSFNRAFRRWHGTTPGEWRAKHGGVSDADIG